MMARSSVCDKRCSSCKHAVRMSGQRKYVACYYLIDMKQRRPCPAGEKCTVYDPLTKPKKKVRLI